MASGQNLNIHSPASVPTLGNSHESHPHPGPGTGAIALGAFFFFPAEFLLMATAPPSTGPWNILVVMSGRELKTLFLFLGIQWPQPAGRSQPGAAARLRELHLTAQR